MDRAPLLVVMLACFLATCKDSTGPDQTVDRVVLVGRPVVYVDRPVTFSVVALNPHGDTLRNPVAAMWATSDSTVATVHNGVVRGVAVGHAVISATLASKTGTAPITVTLVPVAKVNVTPHIDSLYVGTTIQLQATPIDSVFQILPPRPVAWSSSDTTKAVVSNSGLVTARAAGSVVIWAKVDSVIGGAFLNAQYRVASIAMPDSLTMRRFEVVRIVPDLRSDGGTPLAGRPVTWSNSDTTVIALDQSGVITPRAFGRAIVTAASAGYVDSTRVRIVPEPVAQLGLYVIRFAPVDRGTTVLALGVAVSDSLGRDAVGNPVAWTSGDTRIARVAPDPSTDRWVDVTGIAPGTASITAAAGGKTARWTISVRLPAVRLRLPAESLEVAIGAYRNLGGALVDSTGATLGFTDFIHLVAADTGVVVLDSSGTPPGVRGRRAGKTTVIGRTSDGMADTVLVIVPANGAVRLDWSSSRAQIGNYAQGTVALLATDSLNAPSQIPRNVAITSSDTTVVVAVPNSITGMSSSASVTLFGRRSGGARITAQSESLFTTLYVGVLDIPAQAVSISPRPRFMHAGDTVRLRATVTGVDGGVRSYPVVWTASDPSRASISDSGLVTARGGGDVFLLAKVQGRGDSVAVVIQSADPPVVTTISPDTLVPGVTATITGSGFDPSPAANTVRVDDALATVTGASPTGLSFIVPAAGAFPCTPSHAALITATSSARVAVTTAPLRVAVERSLDPGTAVIVPAPEIGCNELTGPYPEYWISVANTAASADAVSAFTVKSAVPPTPASPQAGVSPAPPPRPAPLRRNPSWGISGLSFDHDSLTRAGALHRRLLEESRSLARRAGPPVRLLQAARAAGRPGPQRSVGAMINGVARIRIPRLEDPNFCASYNSVDARLVYSGTHSRIYEDVAAPLAGQMDSYYQAVGQEFDNRDWSELLTDFGNPLALDSLLDNDGAIAMVFSPIVNGYGLAGFVAGCDFYPESVAPSSNTGEILYAVVPTSFAGGFNGFTRDNWRRLIRSVVMHESKHVTAFAERLSRGAPLEESWLEESSAVLSEEIWARSVYGNTWKGNATYRQTLYCDVRPAWPECTDRPYSVFNAFAYLYDYARVAPYRSPLGPTDLGDATFYGSGWSLLRWSIDQYAPSEAAFLRALIQESTLSGAANLAARAGHPFPELVADWSLGWYADDEPWIPSRAQLTFPSWNIRDVFASMSSDFPNVFESPWPGYRVIVPSSGIPDTTVTVRGGSSVLLDVWSFLNTRQLVELRGAGGPLPPELRVQIIRAQ